MGRKRDKFVGIYRQIGFIPLFSYFTTENTEFHGFKTIESLSLLVSKSLIPRLLFPVPDINMLHMIHSGFSFIDLKFKRFD